MKRLFVRGMLPLLLLAGLSLTTPAQNRVLYAQATQSPLEHVITVSRSGTAFAKPDVGILTMAIRATAPVAEEAISADGRTAAAIKSALAVDLGHPFNNLGDVQGLAGILEYVIYEFHL